VSNGLLRVVAEASLDAAWSPVSYSSQLEDEFRCLLRGSVYYVGSVGFDLEGRPSVFLADAVPAVDCFLVGS
jgi:hypothetical protein